MLILPLEGNWQTNRQHLHCTLSGKYLSFIIDTCIICNSCKTHFSTKLVIKNSFVIWNTLVYVMPPQSWGDQGDTKHSKCLLLGGRRLNQMTLIPKPKGSGGARAATAQVGPANKRDDTKRCLLFEALLRPGEAVSW